MTLTEYFLVALVIIVPLIIATAVTIWTLEQARMRSKKNRREATAKRQTPQPPETA
ncbi:MAG TPA: hypothetical protein VIL01_10140 [Thermomicrobiales bacterium]